MLKKKKRIEIFDIYKNHLNTYMFLYTYSNISGSYSIKIILNQEY